MELWKKALTEVADLKGMNANGWRETIFIEEIVKKTSSRLDLCLHSKIPHLIGMHSSVNIITSWLKDGSSLSADILATWGMAGIGKTSLAKISMNCITVILKEAALLEILRGDVSSKRLDVLFGTKGFHLGSKIIVTTKDGSLPEKCGLFGMNVLPKHMKHLLEQLNETESLKLLSWHAFRCNDPKEGYEEESRKVVKHCGGHPLALEVLGSSLYKEDVVAWEATLELLEKELNPHIQKVLQISVDSLPSENDKELSSTLLVFSLEKMENSLKQY